MTTWLLIGGSAALVAEDVIELKTGARPKGTIVSQDENRVVLKMEINGKTFIRTYPRSQIKSVSIDGQPEKSGSPAAVASPAGSGTANTRSRQDVLDLIQAEGRRPPDWYESTALNFPPTLDLTWPEKPGGNWDNQKNVGQYVWDRINPNPSNWRSGVKLMHHLMTVNAGNPDVVKRAMQALGNMYHNLHEDYARAAFWWQQAGVDRNPDANPLAAIHLADCYLKLGNREMALELLHRMWGVPFGAIKLLGDMGETEDALKLAERFASDPTRAVTANLYAGDVCRVAGRLDDAEAYYRKALDAAQRDTRNNDHGRRDKQRAEASLAAIQFYRLSPDKVRDGTYTSSSLGYEDQVHVSVQVHQGRIVAVRVTQHREKQFYSSISDTPRNIVSRQSVVGVDTTSGATITSEAIINATARALSQGLASN